MIGEITPTAARADAALASRHGAQDGGLPPGGRGRRVPAHVVDGRKPHSLLLEIFTDSGIGTMVLARRRLQEPEAHLMTHTDQPGSGWALRRR